jgi:hypothetical protein
VHIAKDAVATHFGQVHLDHFAHQFIECDFMAPAEPLARLARIAKQCVRFGRPEIARIDLNEDAAIALVEPLLG